MRPILIDTNAYTAFKQADQSILEILQQAEVIVMSPIVLGELLGGFDSGSKSKKNRLELKEFLNSSRVTIFPLTSDTSNFYSQVYSSLRKKGKPIPTNDMWIAAQSLEQGCALCTYDKHFTEVEGLLVGKTAAELMI